MGVARRSGFCSARFGSPGEVFQLVVVPAQQINVRQQHQPGDDGRAAKFQRNRDDENVQDEREVDERADGCGSGDEQQEGGGQLAQAEKAPVEACAIHGFKEESDRVVEAEDREAIAEHFGDARRSEGEREKYSGEDGEDS